MLLGLFPLLLGTRMLSRLFPLPLETRILSYSSTSLTVIIVGLCQSSYQVFRKRVNLALLEASLVFSQRLTRWVISSNIGDLHLVRFPIAELLILSQLRNLACGPCPVFYGALEQYCRLHIRQYSSKNV